MRIGMFVGPFVAAAAIHQWGLAGAYGVGIAALAVAAAIMRIPTSKRAPLKPMW